LAGVKTRAPGYLPQSTDQVAGYRHFYGFAQFHVPVVIAAEADRSRITMSEAMKRKATMPLRAAAGFNPERVRD
jgi:hypothetical protein